MLANSGSMLKFCSICFRLLSFIGCKFHFSLTLRPTALELSIPTSVLKLVLRVPPPFVLDAPGRVGNLLAADLHRSIGLSAALPSLWPGRELRKYHCLEVPES